jgi:hypothetical protein
LSEPYNPLSKFNLAKSIEGEILSAKLHRLSGLPNFNGAGIYALYYDGDLDIYTSLAESLTSDSPRPIYVGKAIPEGGRIGGIRGADVRTAALQNRLRNHIRSIKAANNLNVDHFLVRYLVVDDVWIPLGENMLIETYQPVWNRVVAGFGNNPLGKGREKQKPSLWDILHPGRISNIDTTVELVPQDELAERVRTFFATKFTPPDQ